MLHERPKLADTQRVYLDTFRVINVAPNLPVVAHDGHGRAFAAVVASVDAATAQLTFTPRWAPREIGLGMIESVGRKPVNDIDSIPYYQEEAADV